MKIDATARTCPKSRRLIVTRVEEEGWSLAATESTIPPTSRNMIPEWSPRTPLSLCLRVIGPGWSEARQ